MSFKECTESGFEIEYIIDPPCEDFTSIEWSTGDVNTTSIIIQEEDLPEQVAATVTCPNGCVWEIEFEPSNEPQIQANEVPQSSLLSSGIDPHATTRSITNAEERLQVFPNPSTDNVNVTIQSTLVEEAIDIHLYNVEGRLVLSKKYTSNSEGKLITRLDLSSLHPGLYFMKVPQLSEPHAIAKIVIIK